MKIDHIQIKNLEIPFQMSFKHTSAERSVTESVWVMAVSSCGLKGYGEGCPRTYVTNETLDSVRGFFDAYQKEFLALTDIISIKNWVQKNTDLVNKNPAAWCAVETALLDLMGQEKGKSIESLLSLSELAGTFTYSGVLGVAKPAIFQGMLAKYKALGIKDFKVKVSGDIETDIKNLQTIVEGGTEAFTVRLDANNLWKSATEAKDYLEHIPPVFWAVEEPLQARDYHGMKNLSEDLKCQIILDESFLTLDDVDVLNGTEAFIPNIRLSKMGGLIRSLEVAESCAEKNKKFIVGAQVGETSILTRLALSLVNSYRPNVLRQEGGFGEYLLKYDPAQPVLMFGKNGFLSCEQHAARPGLGFKEFSQL